MELSDQGMLDSACFLKDGRLYRWKDSWVPVLGTQEDSGKYLTAVASLKPYKDGGYELTPMLTSNPDRQHVLIRRDWPVEPPT